MITVDSSLQVSMVFPPSPKRNKTACEREGTAMRGVIQFRRAYFQWL